MTLAQFARHLERTASQMPRHERQAMRISGVRLREAARGYIGVPQTSAVPPFGPWAPLKDQTIEDRIAHGYPGNEPLLREGTLRASIQWQVGARELVVFSTYSIAGYQEHGTRTIPSRPFIGRAMAQHGRREAMFIGRAAFRPLLTGRI